MCRSKWAVSSKNNNRPCDGFAKPRMHICLLETFRVGHRVETMGVAVVYSKRAKVSRKPSASEAPEHRTAPSLRCVGLKLSKGLLIQRRTRDPMYSMTRSSNPIRSTSNNCDSFSESKCCADSLSVCPNPVCTCTHKNVCTVKIL